MNQLQYETSPYLLQHAHNPVNWYAWKPEAFEKARQENKPILVSIGYSTCHWCHVMERESFENEAIATIMNENFINIKVDREERPDVDQIYMEACQIISGSGGWPLNCFLLPDGRPFFAGTYYPPQPAHQRPSWTQVLQNISNAYKNQKTVVEEQADKLMDIIKGSDTSLLGNAIEGLTAEQVFTPIILQNLYYNLHQRFDNAEGGFGTSPKFPGTMNLQYLLKYHYFTKDEEALEHLQKSLDKMIMGGIYDQIGGGFARYATDRAWLIPHFEKMLYDNALLVSLLSDTYLLTQKTLYKDTIIETLDWVEREMTNERGGFFAALDADSEGVEGKFYVWDKSEIVQILGAEAEDFNEFYGVRPYGNWEEKNILNRTFDFEMFCSKTGKTNWKAFKQTIKKNNQQLLAERAKRIRPGLDDKSLLDWNALMISAYAKAYTVLDENSYKDRAITALDFIFDNMLQKDGVSLFHTYKNGQAQYDAFLDDYAFLIEALLDVYEITFDTKLLRQAAKYTEYVLEHFLDKSAKLFYFTSANQNDLVTRRKDLYDSATPSGNSTMVRNLQKLGILLEKEHYKNLAQEMLLIVRDTVEKHPTSFGRWGEALVNEVYGIKEIAVVGSEAYQISAELSKMYLPNKVLMASARGGEEFPLLKDKKGDLDTYIYVCTNYVCQKPVRSIQEFKQNLNA